MAYVFNGFFSKALNINQNSLVQGHVYRKATDPFEGCGILTLDTDLSFDEATKYLHSLGISADGDPAEDAFFEALDAFGLPAGSGVVFAPFERGFWGVSCDLLNSYEAKQGDRRE